jgi:uncharacterized membrane protein YfcA
MNITSAVIACVVSFAVSIFSVSIGGTSLITVPLLMVLGMAPPNAVATNMFALLFLSVSGAVAFRKAVKVDHPKIVPLFSALTICGSLIGANLLLSVDKDILKRVIAVFICFMLLTFIVRQDFGIHEKREKLPKWKFGLGALSVFVLGIYGGFFSGGYVTLLSYALILIFGLNFLQVAFMTKIFNVFSSLVACAVFYSHGLIDFSIGLPLAFSMSLGAIAGARIAVKKGPSWIRNLFIAAVLVFSAKLLFFD